LRPLYISLNEEKSKEEEENQSVEKGHTERKQLGWLSKQKRRGLVFQCVVYLEMEGGGGGKESRDLLMCFNVLKTRKRVLRKVK